MAADGGFDSPVNAAAARLEAAIERLRQRLAARAPTPDASESSSALAAELAAARVRQRELEAAGAQASTALDRAIGEIRAALGERG